MIRVSAKLIGVIKGIPVPTTLVYTPQEDPFGIAVTFMPPQAEHVKWRFSRDLLIDGLVNPQGEGDVRILTGFEFIDMMVQNGGQSAVFRFTRRDIADFCQKITKVVPRGTEDAWFDWESEFKLLGEPWDS